MNRDVIIKRFSEMALVFRVNITTENFDGLIRVWERLLQDESESKFECFCDNHLMKSKYFPVPADYFSSEGKKEWWDD